MVTAASGLVPAVGPSGLIHQHSSSNCRVRLRPGGSAESPAAGPGAAAGKATHSTHQPLRRQPRATEQPTHRLVRGRSVWRGISRFYSLGHRLIKEKQGQSPASKLCVRRSAAAQHTESRAPVLLLRRDATIPWQRLSHKERTTKGEIKHRESQRTNHVRGKIQATLQCREG